MFHDFGHCSYFPSILLNKIVGTVFGVFVLTPYPSWKYDHGNHHKYIGNADNKANHNFNDFSYLSKREYQAFHPITKLIYKIFVYPFLFHFHFPFSLFFIANRFFMITTYPLQIMFHNIALFAWCYFLNSWNMLYQYLFSMWIASAIIVAFFYCQHTFNPPYVIKKNEDWNVKDSGLKGSSFIQIPYPLKYFWAGIEYHHIHHMNSKIPSYNLQRYHDMVTSTSDKFNDVVKLTLRDCYDILWLKLYDEEINRFITLDGL
jgi:omega-6 fatty acid desaturase (delta-12 desaturase)